ncbi:MAG: D-glycero-beta-D-manno-heptose 1-phosphate adenylyltransferase [Negativicutes bacterium]|jgi:glycerol-3-phosphate cytidylyltransferase
MNKLISRKVAQQLCDELKSNGNTVVFSNGCFDILHAGHVRYLNAAKKYGDIMILGLNTDASVKSFKGDLRPVNSENDRAEVVSGLSAVDFVVFFGERTASELIQELKPSVYVKGGDYLGVDFPEKTLVESYGGRVEFVSLVEGRSTTNIIEKMQRVAAQQQ